jgi:hypothetical protein
MMNEERDCFSSLCRACYTCEACITCQHYDESAERNLDPADIEEFIKSEGERPLWKEFLDAFVYVWTFKWLKITFRERKKK